MKIEEAVVKIVLRDRLAESLKRYVAMEPGPGVATSAVLMSAAPRLLQEMRQQQEAALTNRQRYEHYTERVRVEAEAYGISEETICKLDATGIPWRRAVSGAPKTLTGLPVEESDV